MNKHKSFDVQFKAHPITNPLVTQKAQKFLGWLHSANLTISDETVICPGKKPGQRSRRFHVLTSAKGPENIIVKKL